MLKVGDIIWVHLYNDHDDERPYQSTRLAYISTDIPHPFTRQCEGNYFDDGKPFYFYNDGCVKDNMGRVIFERT